MASKRQLKNKIQAVGNIKQMTKAMELVAATKMRKSEERALAARPYAKEALKLLNHIVMHSQTENLSSPFFQRADAREEGKVCLVVITSDRGLAGAFNSQVVRNAAHFLAEKEADIVAVGKKARDFFKKKRASVVAEFLDFSDIVTLQDAEPLSQWILQKFLKGEYSRVMVCSTQFVSALNTRVEIHQLLPLQKDALEKVVDNIIPERGKYSDIASLNSGQSKTQELSYLLEPSAQEIFEELIEDLVKVEILHFLYESNASEHSSRMIAMKNATDNAGDLMTRLSLDLNKLRQSAITQELNEISTAKEALTSE